jgi:2'-5' RNA ligase
MNAELTRSFIALEFSDEVKNEFTRVEKLFKASDADVKWVDPLMAHLTLKFLGDITNDQIDSISARLQEVASHFTPFGIKLEGAGSFPKWDFPRVVWIGIGEGGEAIKKVAQEVEDAMVEEGFERENRAFSPHITIGRVKSPKNKDKLKNIASKVEVNPVFCDISRIVLFKSELLRTGAVYSELAAFPFIGHRTSDVV